MRNYLQKAVVLTVLTATACQKTPQFQKINGFAQGSFYTVSYYTDNRQNGAEKLQPSIDSILEAFDLCASLWNDSSEICRVNRNENFQPSPMFCDMFEKSQNISRLTNGAFDITVSPLVKHYGFSKKQPEDKNRLSASGQNIMDYVGWEKVRLEDGFVKKNHPLLQLDFNAVAQGYAADMLARWLQDKGIDTYLVNVGGEICAKGTKPDGRCWVVGIEKPAPDAFSAQTVQESMYLENMSLVTSGSYRKYFEEGGERYSHTIDPFTGRPVKHNLLSATVLCKECWEADALATACMVWGVDASKTFLLEHNDAYQGYLIFSEPVEGTDSVCLKTWHTPGFPLTSPSR